jgi:hypothetical protein
MRCLASRHPLVGAYFEVFATTAAFRRGLSLMVMLIEAMSFPVAPMNTRRSQFASHFRETEIGRVFSSMNSEPSLRSLADTYVMTAEFWTKAPEAPAIAA